MEMKAIYMRNPNCHSCIDIGCYDPAHCPECLEAQKEEVTIVLLGAGPRCNKAVVKFKNGTLAPVPLSDLTVIE